jgi:hypothetical protein
MSDVDQLFGRGDDAPKPRTATIAAMVFGGLLVAVVGLGCTVIPGLGLVAWGWNVAEVDWARATSGYYASESQRRAWWGRLVAILALLAAFGLLFVQLWLVWAGFYHVLWGGIVAQIINALPE